MKLIISFLALGIISLGCASKVKQPAAPVDKKTIGLLPTEKQPVLVEIAEFKGTQLTGVTVSKNGRMFANFPRWRNNVPFSVVEVFPDGTHRPYPNKNWNTWEGSPQENRFTCIQSLLAYNNSLYVLDPSSPNMKEVLGKAKLYQFDLASDKLVRTWEFDESVAPKKSYLNDLRIDKANKNIYITDSGLGGIVVLDTKTGQAKRVLDKHPSTKAENITLTVDKKEVSTKIHSDGIAPSPIDNKLYYHALTSYSLYRIPSSILGTESKDETQLVKKVERLGPSPASDGMIFDKDGNLYMADLERNAISYRTPKGEMKILIQDERLKWPDSFTIDGENNLIFTDSLLQVASPGMAVDDLSFKIYKVALPKTL